MTWRSGCPRRSAPGSRESKQWLSIPDALVCCGYLNGILAYLPDAIVTVACFHGVKLANTLVDDVRRRTQQETLGHRGHKDDPLYSTRRLMTRGWERLSDRQRVNLALRDEAWVATSDSSS